MPQYHQTTLIKIVGYDNKINKLRPSLASTIKILVIFEEEKIYFNILVARWQLLILCERKSSQKFTCCEVRDIRVFLPPQAVRLVVLCFWCLYQKRISAEASANYLTKVPPFS